MLSFLTSVVLVLLLLLIASFNFVNSSDLDRIPAAHFTAPFSRFWLLVVRWRSVENRTRIQIHRQLGPVVRIGPREVSVDCVDDGTRLIYSSKFARDERLYGLFVDRVPFLATMIGNEEHKKRKRMLSHVYSKSHILNSPVLDTTMLQVLNRFIAKIEDCASKGASVNILAQCKACMLDITTGWIYGTENSTNTVQEEASRTELVDMLQLSFDYFFWRYEFRWLFNFFHRLSRSTDDTGTKLQRWFTHIHQKAYDAHERKSSLLANVYDCLFDRLKRDDPELSHAAVDAIITPELEDQLVAGHSTTAIAVSYSIYELSRSPRLQRMLREELRTLAEPSSRSRAQRIEELPVLDAVVTETLRVRSPNPGPWPRVVPEGGCRIAGGFDLPAGTIVSSSSWTLHRNETVFPSPEEWRPERWLETNESTRHEMRRWMWAFGSGVRMCIGVHFAIRAFKEIIAALYNDHETLLDLSSTGNMDQIDALIAGPVGDSLNIELRRCE